MKPFNKMELCNKTRDKIKLEYHYIEKIHEGMNHKAYCYYNDQDEVVFCLEQETNKLFIVSIYSDKKQEITDKIKQEQPNDTWWVTQVGGGNRENKNPKGSRICCQLTEDNYIDRIRYINDVTRNI